MIPWNRFEVYFLKIPFSPISSINFPSDLIKFEDYIKKLLNSLWIRPVFTIIPLNSIHFHQIGKFGIIFDAIPREIDDLAVSSRQGVDSWMAERRGKQGKGGGGGSGCGGTANLSSSSGGGGGLGSVPAG